MYCESAPGDVFRNNIFNYCKVSWKTGQNEKSHVFQEIGIPGIDVQLLENFQTL